MYLEVVVHSVHNPRRRRVLVSPHMRRPARKVMEPVARQGNVVLLADEEHRPVVLPVAARGPLGAAVELVIRDGDVASRAPARDDHLTADEGKLVVVDPDAVGVVEGDGVAAPDELGVELLQSR